jgi:hypothetical protein
MVFGEKREPRPDRPDDEGSFVPEMLRRAVERSVHAVLNTDEERKKLYLKRHEKNENWNDPKSRGALSRWILWNKKTLSASIADFKKRFNL